MPFAASARRPTSEIPVVDIGPLRDNSDPGGVARAICDANRSLGFFYVANHGFPRRLLTEIRTVGLEFFRQPESVKRQLGISPAHRGFLDYGDAKMYSGAKADLKQSFLWGTEWRPGGAQGGKPNRFQGANRWPAELPDLKRCCMAYFHAAHELAQLLLRAFAIGLSLSEEAFLTGSRAPISRGSLIYYPPQHEDLEEDRFGVAPHTDFGVLTLLAQDHVGGLQVKTASGEWIDARPIEDTFVVNVGDLLERWTNGRYRSTPHRVINTSSEERLSAVLAYDPEYDTLIDSTITCAAGESPAAPPIKCGDYLDWRFRQAFAYRQN